MRNDFDEAAVGLADPPSARARPGDGWLRLHRLEGHAVHAWPASAEGLVDLLVAALEPGHGRQEPRPVPAPDGGLLVVSLAHPLARAELQRLRMLEHTRLQPIAVHGGDARDVLAAGLADRVVGEGPSAALQALAALETLAERLLELPPAADLTASERRELDFLRFVHSRQVTELHPLPDADSPIGFRYPLAETLLHLGPLEAVQALEDFRGLGLFEGTLTDRVYLCGACHSNRLALREVCPTCRVPSLVSQLVIHHFRCAHVGPAEEFQRKDRLICPKCARELNHVGVDHDRPGAEQRCERCRASWLEPEVEARCLTCDARSSPDRARLLDLRTFQPAESLARAARQGSPPVAAVARLVEGCVLPTDPAVHLMMRDHLERTCRRYHRPASFLTVGVRDAAALRAEVGRDELRRRLVRLTHVIREMVRGTDIVGMPQDDAIEILLVETPLEGARVVAERLRRAFALQVDSSLDVNVEESPLLPEDAS